MDLLLDATRDGPELRVLLQRLAGDVERHIGRVDDAAHEVVVVGQEVGALLLDEDVRGVEREALLVVLAVEVEGLLGRDEEQGVVRERALGVEANRALRLLPVVEGRLVELVVVLLFDLTRALLPDGRHGVEGLELLVILVLGLVVVAGVLGLGLLAALGDHHLDGMAHVVGVARHEVAQAPLGEEAVGVVLVGRGTQVERHVGAVVVLARALALCGGLDGVAAPAVRLPRKGLVRAVRAAHHADLLGDHEGGVEAHAKLADDVHVLALVLGVCLLEGLRARVGDGAKVLVQLVLGHADAVVTHRDGAHVLVEGQTNGKRVLVNVDVGVGEALEAELVDGVRRVGDKLAEEDLLVGVDRVDHEVQELLGLRLELLHACFFPLRQANVYLVTQR